MKGCGGGNGEGPSRNSRDGRRGCYLNRAFAEEKGQGGLGKVRTYRKVGSKLTLGITTGGSR